MFEIIINKSTTFYEALFERSGERKNLVEELLIIGAISACATIISAYVGESNGGLNTRTIVPLHVSPDPLSLYGTDLTKLATEGKLQPYIGNKSVLNNVMQNLCHMRKNNLAIVGEPGIGKTAIVEELARAIHEGQVPEKLRNKRIVSVDVKTLFAGARYVGDAEERVTTLLNSVKKAGNVILFFDEIHMILGAGSHSTNPSGSLANHLKPALARGDFICIGATTNDEYQEHIVKDKALERRFNKVQLEAPSSEQTFEILEGLKNKFEEYHQVQYSPEALKKAIELSEKHWPTRFQPDKAIDVIDHVGTLAYNNNECEPTSVADFEAYSINKHNDLKQRIEDLQKKIDEETNSSMEASILGQLYHFMFHQTHLVYTDDESHLKELLSELTELKKMRKVISTDDVEKMFSYKDSNSCFTQKKRV